MKPTQRLDVKNIRKALKKVSGIEIAKLYAGDNFECDYATIIKDNYEPFVPIEHVIEFLDETLSSIDLTMKDAEYDGRIMTYRLLIKEILSSVFFNLGYIYIDHEEEKIKFDFKLNEITDKE